MLCSWDLSDKNVKYCKTRESKRKIAEKESSKWGKILLRFVETTRIKKELDRIYKI